MRYYVRIQQGVRKVIFALSGTPPSAVTNLVTLGGNNLVTLSGDNIIAL